MSTTRLYNSSGAEFRGKFRDWYVERVGHKHWVIFHKEVNQEWQNEQGDNLCFETKKEAVAYLKKEFEKEG